MTHSHGAAEPTRTARPLSPALVSEGRVMGHRLAARQIDPALGRNPEGEHEIAVQPTRARARTVARAQSSYPARPGGRSVPSKRGPMTDAYVGVDVSKAWLDVAVRPSGEV